MQGRHLAEWLLGAAHKALGHPGSQRAGRQLLSGILEAAPWQLLAAALAVVLAMPSPAARQAALAPCLTRGNQQLPTAVARQAAAQASRSAAPWVHASRGRLGS